MKSTDYLILGAGASGLMLAYRMAKDPFFANKSIRIVDKKQNKGDDRTWCFWEKGMGEWDSLVVKEWNQIYFGAQGKTKKIPLGQYNYKMIRSAAFYQKLWLFILSKENFTFQQDEVNNIYSSEHEVEVRCSSKHIVQSKYLTVFR